MTHSTIETKSKEQKLLELAVTFTQRHQDNSELPLAMREIDCRKVNFPHTLLEPLPEDLFVGRIARPVADFTNAYFPETELCDTMGYYFDDSRAQRYLKETGQENTTLAEKIQKCTEYWKEKQSEYKITSRMDADMLQALPSFRFWQDSAISHRLYRLVASSMDYSFLLEKGLPGLQEYYLNELELIDNGDEKSEDFLQACADMCNIFLESLAHYSQVTTEILSECNQPKRESELERIKLALEALQNRPPETFFEAIQLFHIFNVVGFYCHCFGRIDNTLGSYLANDLKSGHINEEEAVKMLINLWGLMNEHFDNSRLTIGGVGRDNTQAADIFTRIALEATRRFYEQYQPRERFQSRVASLSPQVALRISNETPQDIYDQAIDILATGITFPLLYNDDVNVSAVAKAFDVSIEDARDYTFFDCGEYVIDKQSIGTPSCIISLPKALEVALNQGIDPLTDQKIGPSTPPASEIDSFDSLWNAYTQQVEFATEQSARFQKHVFDMLSEDGAFVGPSMLQPDSRKQQRGILHGGCVMLGGTYETYGNITAADSLLALKELVFDEQKLSLSDFKQALSHNYEGYDSLYERVRQVPKFGNDDPKADSMAQRVHNHICEFTRDQADKVGLHHYLVVVINNSANVALGHHVGATADGRKAGLAVSNGNTPSAGNDKNGITAVLNSIVKLSPDHHAGAVHNLRFSKTTINQYRPQVSNMIRSYFDTGGTQCMLTITSRDELLDAQKHPEKYSHLLVRLGGFSARFIDLPVDVQQEVINRNAY